MSEQPSIPLVDLAQQHAEVATEVEAGFSQLVSSCAFILGPQVREFEAAFAAYAGVPECVGVANGTDALELMLRAAGIGQGHKVILPANTFIATALAVARAGATPLLVDCDRQYHLIDADQVEARIRPPVKAVIAVNLFGQMAPLEQLRALCDRAGILLFEDAAQSQGARRNGRAMAGVSEAAATSFYPGKNLGAYGDAGAVLTRSPEIGRRVRALRNYGSETKYHHPEQGFNSRLDSLQAIVLSAKLKRLEAWNQQRRAAAARYHDLLADVAEVVRPATLSGNEHVWHLYVVRVPNRDQLLARLTSAGIGAGVHYPLPIHLQGAFKHLGHQPGAFPEAEQAAREVLSLPLYPGITPRQQERVVSALKDAISGGA